MDPALLELAHQELKSLQDTVAHMFVEFQAKKTGDLGISEQLKEINQRLEKLDTGKQN